MSSVLLICRLVIVALSILSWAFAHAAEPNKVFRLAVYSMDYTDPPRGGNAIIAHAMEQYGYRLKFVSMPVKRMQGSLKNGVIDAMMASGFARETRQRIKKDSFIQSTYPITVFPVSIYYRHSTEWAPSWPAKDDFKKNAHGVTLSYQYLSHRGFNISQISSFEAGEKMVNVDRADYWIDMLHTGSGEYILPNKDDKQFTIAKLFDNALFLLFNDNERGRQFKQIWDTELLKVMRTEGRYAELYLRGYSMEIYGKRLNDYIDYIYAQYPETKF